MIFSTYIGGDQKYALTWFLVLPLSALPEVVSFFFTYMFLKANLAI